jgi:hypothetical protein
MPTAFRVNRSVPQRTRDPPANVVQLVEPSEALQVLHHRSTVYLIAVADEGQREEHIPKTVAASLNERANFLT